MELAHSRTLTKIQGMSLDFRHYIDFRDMRTHGNKQVHHKTANAHVVGLTRATDPDHLKIINGFDEELMGRSTVADAEVDRLRTDPNAQLIFRVIDLKQTSGTNIVFYNLQGLKTHAKDGTKPIENLIFDTNLTTADFILGAETNLDASRNGDYSDIPGYQALRFDSSFGKTGRGLVMYSKIGTALHSIEVDQSENLEIVQFSVNVQSKALRIVFLYRSKQHPVSMLKQNLAGVIDYNEDERNLIIIGDMNTEDSVIDDERFLQQIDGPTTSGIKGNKIDHAYTRLADFDSTGHVLYKCFTNSYHHPICVNLGHKKP